MPSSVRSKPTYVPLAAICALCTLLVACASGPSGPQLLVGAASSLEPLLTELADEFEAETGVQLSFTFSASGALAQQIREGAPIDVFVSADARFMEDLANDGFVATDTLAHFADGVLVSRLRSQSR